MFSGYVGDDQAPPVVVLKPDDELKLPVFAAKNAVDDVLMPTIADDWVDPDGV